MTAPGGATSALERGVVAGLAVVLAVVAVDWGLPNHTGWDVDSIAPHGPIAVGVADVSGLDPIYPLFHHALSAALYLPLLRVEIDAGTFDPALHASEPLRAFADPIGSLSTLILVSRLLTVLMAVGCVLLAHSLAVALLRSTAAARLVAVLAATGHAFVYYAHTGNLDVPYLFWSLAALRAMVALDAATPRRRLLVATGALIALAVATKDQAYGLFALTLPWLLLRLHRRGQPSSRVALPLASAAVVYVIASGALLAPDFYRRHVETILGEGKSPAGRVALPAWLDESERAAATRIDRAALMRDGAGATVHSFGHAVIGLPLTIAGLLGLGLGHRPLRPLLLAALGYLLTFLLPAGYAPIRFLLPVWMILVVGVGHLHAVTARRWPGPALAAAGLAAAASTWSGLVTLDKLRNDNRYAFEDWMADRIAPTEQVEVFSTASFPIYHPRFPPQQPVRSRGFAYWQAARAAEIDRATDWVLFIHAAPASRLAATARLQSELDAAGSEFVHAVTFARRPQLDPDAIDPLSPDLVLYRRRPHPPAR